MRQTRCIVCGKGLGDGLRSIDGGLRFKITEAGMVHELCAASDATQPALPPADV